MPPEEAPQAAGAGLHAVPRQGIAQLTQKDLRPRLVEAQDQVGMRLNAVRGMVATQRLGCNLAFVLETLRPTAGSTR